ncbi:hypothetical protein IRZ57_10510 [Pseudomonas guariconensis]|nr:hypothetical protein [Pseudomonas guariconensis]
MSGTKADTWTVELLIGSNAVGLSDTVTLTAGAVEAGKSDFSASPKTIAANGTAESRLKFIAKDAEGNLVTGIADQLSFSVKNGGGGDAGSAVTVTTAKETTPGTYEADLSGTKADTWTVELLIGSNAVGLSDDVVLTPGAVDTDESEFTASPDSIVAGSGQESELTLTAKDAKGNLVPGIVGDLEFEVIDSIGGAAGTDVTIKDLQETTPGVYTAKLTGTKVETWRVTPLYKKTRLGTLTKTVKLTATAPAPDTSVFSVSATSGLPSFSKITLTLEAKDASGNPLTGLASGLQFVVKKDSLGRPLEPGDVDISEVQETATPGTYTAKFGSAIIDDHTIVPLFNGADIGKLSQTVTLKYPYPSEAKVYKDGAGNWLESNTLVKSANFRFIVGPIPDNKDNYDATIVTSVSWLSKTATTGASFEVTDTPLTPVSVQIKLLAKKGNDTITYTMTPFILKPSKDKLSYADATVSCDSQGGRLANGIVPDAWKDWQGLSYENDLHWHSSGYSGTTPSLFDPVTGKTQTSAVDPTAKHYYVCMTKN